MSQRKNIFIVAGNLEEFKAYVDKKQDEWTKCTKFPHYEFAEYVYVESAWQQLEGLTEVEGYYIGSYKNRDDLDEIKWTISRIKASGNLTSVISPGPGNGSGLFKKYTTVYDDPLYTQSNTNTISVGPTQYSYAANPSLESRTKALEETLEWIKKQIESVAP